MGRLHRNQVRAGGIRDVYPRPGDVGGGLKAPKTPTQLESVRNASRPQLACDIADRPELQPVVLQLIDETEFRLAR